MHEKGEYNKEIENLYKLYHNDLVHIALCYTSVGYLAEDAVQEAFRCALSNPDSLLTSDNPKRWLIVTLKYVICNMNRVQQKLSCAPESMPDAAADDDSLSVSEIKIELQRYLSPEDYKLVSLVTFYDMTYKQAAKEMGLSIYAFKQRLHRVRKRLRTYLGSDYKNF